jgi:hypothetical protein
MIVQGMGAGAGVTLLGRVLGACPVQVPATEHAGLSRGPEHPKPNLALPPVLCASGAPVPYLPSLLSASLRL